MLAPHTQIAFTDRVAAQAEWSALAGLIAGRADVRLAVRRDGRWQYPRTRQRPLPVELPEVPAAVLLYDRAGRLPLLVLDLDAKSSSRDQVNHDTEVACALLSGCGLAPVVDEGPTGGRHVYCRLPAPVTKDELVPVASGLKSLLPSLDTAPILNPVAGCIRPPGSPHTAGGYQRLLGDPVAAAAALSATPPLAGWNQLLAHTVPATPSDATPEPDQDQPGNGHPGEQGNPQPMNGRLLNRRPIPRWIQHQARNGPIPGRYRSDSEARFAIMTACRRAGWQLPEVVGAIQGWKWLKDSYATKHHSALVRDWRKTQTQSKGYRAVRQFDTSHPLAQRGGHQREVVEDLHLSLRQFTTFGRRLGIARRFPPAVRAVFDALCGYGHMQNRYYVDPGLRSLGEAAGVDHSTVGHVLHFLAAQGLIRRVGSAHGLDADVWRLNIELGQGCGPARGRRIGMHRLFRVLGGHLVAEVYQTLSEQTQERSVAELAARLGYCRSAVYEAVELLGAYHLAQSHSGKWTIGTANADALSKTLGGEEHWKAQHRQHVKERALWHRRLDRGAKPVTPEECWALFRTEMAAVEPPDPLTSDVGWTQHERQRRQALRDQRSLRYAVGLLVDELGGTLIGVSNG